MFSRIAVACFALYCVHGSQNSARDVAALSEQGKAAVQEAAAKAPQAALKFCLENQSLCAQTVEAVSTTSALTREHKVEPMVEPYPLPPRRPQSHKKA